MKLKLITLFSIAFVILILYILFNVLYSSKTLIQQNYLGTGLIPIQMSELKDFQTKTYFMRFGYINSVDKAASAVSSTTVGNNNLKGNIFYIDNMISLDLYQNTALYVNVYNSNGLYDNYNVTQALSLQRWQQVIISVQNYLMDFYLNGKLLKSIELTANNGVPVPTANTKINFGSTDAYIAKFNRSSSTLTTDVAWKKYLAGNSGIIPMHANLTLTTDPTNNTKRFDLF